MGAGWVGGMGASCWIDGLKRWDEMRWDHLIWSCLTPAGSVSCSRPGHGLRNSRQFSHSRAEALPVPLYLSTSSTTERPCHSRPHPGNDSHPFHARRYPSSSTNPSLIPASCTQGHQQRSTCTAHTKTTHTPSLSSDLSISDQVESNYEKRIEMIISASRPAFGLPGAVFSR